MAEGRTVVKYVAIGCGVALLIGIIAVVSCVGVCGACIGGGMMMTEGAVAVSTGFFDDLRAGNVEGAYARMADSYRSANDLEAFRQTVEGTPVMTQQTGVAFMGRNINAGQQTRVRLSGTLQAPSGPASVEMHCVQVGEQWFIEAVSVQGEVFQGTQVPTSPMGFPSSATPGQPQSPFGSLPQAQDQPQGNQPPAVQPPTDQPSQPAGDASAQP